MNARLWVLFAVLTAAAGCGAGTTNFPVAPIVTSPSTPTPTPTPSATPVVGVAASPSSLTFTNVGAANAQSFTVTETGFSGTFSAQSGNTGIATVAQTGPGAFSVTPVASGMTTISISDGQGNTGTVAVTVTLTPITVQIRP